RLRGDPRERRALRQPVPFRGAARRRGDLGMRRGLLLAFALAFAGCATSTAFREGEKAERAQQYDRAVLEYSKAAQSDPDNTNYRLSLGRARLRASESHAVTARRFAARGEYKEAVDEYRLALDLNPDASSLRA